MLPIICVAISCALASGAGVIQASDVKELAQYRLTPPVFEQFQHASRLIAVAMRDDAGFASAPLFTRDVLVLGDVTAMAAQLETRLEGHPRLITALWAANINAREYTRFALALFAARLAHGFVTAGVLRIVPPGVATDNVRFVDTHLTAIAAVLKDLGVDDTPGVEPNSSHRVSENGEKRWRHTIRVQDYSVARL